MKMLARRRRQILKDNALSALYSAAGRGGDAEVSHVLSGDSETSKGSPAHSVGSEWKFSSSFESSEPESEAHESSAAEGSLAAEGGAPMMSFIVPNSTMI